MVRQYERSESPFGRIVNAAKLVVYDSYTAIVNDMSRRDKPPAAILGDIADAQRGYFTRAQAAMEGVDDMRLQRVVANGSVERLDHGVYRITGAGQDPHQALRVAWLRLSPDATPRERTLRPHLWVSHRSAARLLGLGVVAADVPEFISDTRVQTRADVIVRVRSGGLKRSDWMVNDGFAVTTPARTVADLAADRMDGGQLGRIASDALERGVATIEDLDRAVAGRVEIASIVAQAAGKML